jgi:hypothetical protein
MQWMPNQQYLGVPPKDQLIMKFDQDGKALQLWTFPLGVEGKERPGEVDALHGIAVDSGGNIYVGDILGKRAQKFVRVDGITASQ